MDTSSCSEPKWFKSTMSSCNGSCVEVRPDNGLIHVRDSKDVALGVERILTVKEAQWARFIRDLVAPYSTNECGETLLFERRSDGHVELRSTLSSTVLTYTSVEWDAFLDGVVKQEFSLI